MAYITRELERKFLKLNDFFKVILVTGARQVGKTTMLKHLAGSDRTYVTIKELRFLVSYASLPSTTFYPMRTAPTKVRFEAQLFIIPPKRSFSNCANSVCS